MEEAKLAPLTAVRMEDGRRAFGGDAANYDAARPEYPDSVFDVLRERCGLGVGTATFEIGPGTGLATRRLIAAGASPLVAVEPDGRLAKVLRQRLPDAPLEIVEKSFEEAALPESAFDLGASATAFHWLEQRSALAKVASLLKPGGWWAMWWNVFGDPERADPFHEATSELLRADLPPGERHDWRPNFALDREARLASLDADGLFEGADCRMTRWTLTLDPAGVRALYASFSHIGQLGESERRRILDRLAEIAEKEFGGRVERNMVTALYAARRRADHSASGQPVSSNTSSSRASQASSLASA